MSGSVTAVIVNWNGRDDTFTCLESLTQATLLPGHIIVVDNGSTDGSIEAIRETYPQVEIIALPENRHFAAGANIGMQSALDQGAEYVWLLNNDVTVTPGALNEMVHVMEADQTIGIAGARLVHPGTPPRIVVGANCDFRTGGIIEPAPPANPALDRLVVDYVWGCAMLIRAGLLYHIGLFDETLIAYFEDTDLCLRAKVADWKTVGAVQAEVYHEGSKTANRVFLQQMSLRGRNWWRVFMRHAPDENRSRLAIWLLGYRLPHLAWSTLFTIVVRAVRPKTHPIQLWSAR